MKSRSRARRVAMVKTRPFHISDVVDFARGYDRLTAEAKQLYTDMDDPTLDSDENFDEFWDTLVVGVAPETLHELWLWVRGVRSMLTEGELRESCTACIDYLNVLYAAHLPWDPKEKEPYFCDGTPLPRTLAGFDRLLKHRASQQPAGNNRLNGNRPLTPRLADRRAGRAGLRRAGGNHLIGQ